MFHHTEEIELPRTAFRRARAAIRVVAALAIAGTSLAARADFPTETFEGAPTTPLGSGPVPGAGFEIVAGNGWITTANDVSHGRVLDLASGWYAWTYDPATDVGYSTARTVSTFNLLAGYTYTLAFDYSRQAFSAGNGPFQTALVASLGDFSQTFAEVAGFYYGETWHSVSLSWVQATTQIGQHIVFTATGPGGYSGMDIDNVAMAGLPPTVTNPVPEPETWALMLASLGLVGRIVRRRRA